MNKTVFIIGSAPEADTAYVRKMYETWSQPAKNEKLTVPIFYTSAYGNTRKLAEAIKTGILEEKSDAVCDLYDIIDHDLGAQAQLLNSSDAFALGSPTINRDAVPPAWMLLRQIRSSPIRRRSLSLIHI